MHDDPASPRPPRHRPALSLTALRLLHARLDAVVPAHGDTPRSLADHRRLVRRAAVTVRLAPRWLDRVPDGLVPHHDLRLFVLTYRWARDHRGRPRPRAPLACLAPHVDLHPHRPGSGRVLWTPRHVSPKTRGRVWDMTARDPARPYALDPRKPHHLAAARLGLLMDQACCDTVTPTPAATGALELPRFLYAFGPERPPVLEPTFPPHEWAAAEVRVGSLRAWPALMFTRDPATTWARHPVDGSPDPWAAGLAGAAGVHGDWFRDGHGRPTPGAQRPAAVYADLRGLGDRDLRNPAFDVLAAAGVITDRNFAAFLDRVTVRAGDTRVLTNHDDPATPAGALRHAVDAAVLAPDGSLVPDARDELAAACEVADFPPPPGDLTALALFRAPWRRLTLPGAPPLQVLDLPDGPRPGALVFANPEQQVDLYDTAGYDGARYDVLSDAELAGLARQRRRLRRGEPWNRRNGAPRAGA